MNWILNERGLKAILCIPLILSIFLKVILWPRYGFPRKTGRSLRLLALMRSLCMRIIFQITRPLVLTLLAMTSFMAETLAREVSIPDPGLNAAVRAALQKPVGPLG